jgi:transcriptional regulator with XRE-family HTH domain
MIGSKIRILRERNKIDPKVFAEKLDIDLSTLNRIENNKISTFKPDFLLKIAKELNSSIGELFDQATNIAVQNNEQGQNINVLNQQAQSEKFTDNENYWRQLVKAKEDIIREKEYVHTLIISQLEAQRDEIEDLNIKLMNL